MILSQIKIKLSFQHEGVFIQYVVKDLGLHFIVLFFKSLNNLVFKKDINLICKQHKREVKDRNFSNKKKSQQQSLKWSPSLNVKIIFMQNCHCISNDISQYYFVKCYKFSVSGLSYNTCSFKMLESATAIAIFCCQVLE